MSYEVRPLIDGRVVLITVSGHVSLAQVRVGGEQVDALVSAGEPPVHVIIDITRMSDYPITASKIFELSPFLRNPRLGMVPAFGVTNMLLVTLLRVIGQMAPFRYQIVDSMSEAVALLQSQDSRIHIDLADSGSG